MPTGIEATGALDSVVHIIQVSLAPVFLLNGIATLLNVFSSRLARVADQTAAVARQLEAADAPKIEFFEYRLTVLRRRSRALDIAVALGATAGVLTCATVLALFVGEAGGPAIGAMLFISFGLAIACSLVSIAAYTTEMLIASHHVRATAVAGEKAAEAGME
jgi:Protein of unknown function (DUF2721)